jgi:predicted DNA-binding transcriptional regulator AlpA
MNQKSKKTLRFNFTGTVIVDWKNYEQLTFQLKTPQNALSRNVTPGETGFINEKELLKRIPVSRRTLFNWRTTGKIPSVRLGGRRVLFHWPSIEAALLRKQMG